MSASTLSNFSKKHLLMLCLKELKPVTDLKLPGRLLQVPGRPTSGII